MNWPTFFPRNCPPAESKAAAGIVYRLINRTTPGPEDFKSHRERFPNRIFSSECQACGLSVYTDKDDIARLKKRIPGMRAKQVASGKLDANSGQLLHTSSAEVSHHTWWLPLGVEPWHDFQVVSG